MLLYNKKLKRDNSLLVKGYGFLQCDFLSNIVHSAEANRLLGSLQTSCAILYLIVFAFSRVQVWWAVLF